MKMPENKSKFIFFGTAEFSTIILEKLIKAGFIPEAVVCNPDKPIGRKKIITPPPTKILAEKHNIDILQPEKLLDIKSQLSDVKCQLFIVAAYSKIIPKEILKIPRLGTIGVHPSLLPKYRGSSPIQTAILNGEKETGTTLYLMDEKVDHGPILTQQKADPRFCETESGQFLILLNKLAELSADLLIEILPNIENKIKNAEPQDETQATYTKKFTTEDAFIEPKDLEKAQAEGSEIATHIDRKIRALNPEPGVFTIINNKRMKILEAKLTSEGKLKLKKVQIEGKKPIFLN